MKRFIFVIALLFGVATAAKADDRPIDITALPRTAQQFISTHFGSATVVYANQDRDLLDTDYEVRLSDGTKIDFNGSGEWTDISNKHTGVAMTVVPAALAAYVKQHYDSSLRILSLERDSRHYELKLSNGVELIFSLNGKLIGFDD